MRYKIAGIFLLLLFGINLYAIVTDIVQEKNREPLYYYAIVLVALVLGIYFLFFKKRRS
ncbi:hypothetical protein I5M27_01350 [Adhaeribacter sp. BT258]|uniref:LPXTG-motif cell wall anchor domain-containing protein n=1 Tax=Adhaeribacter terrigena TaxID=2793070 RepID=A0ABS1BX27_9BACT|nr:hypothetical protein [Adhaeribacter terrigena]MBK0401609.1 hypothetical protein [Adhaeribacter terrigena]